MRRLKLRFLLLLLISACGTKQADIAQPCAHFYENETDLSIRNSIVAVSAVPALTPSGNPACPGVQLFVSSGTSLASAGIEAAQIAGGLSPKMAVAPTNDKGIFNTDDWAESLVRKLDGSTFQIVVPGLAQPIVVVYHAPRAGN